MQPPVQVTDCKYALLFAEGAARGGCKLASTVEGVKGNDDDESSYLQICSGPGRGGDGPDAGWLSADSSPDNRGESASCFESGDHHLGAHIDQHLRNQTDHSADRQSGWQRHTSRREFDNHEVHYSREEKRVKKKKL